QNRSAQVFILHQLEVAHLGLDILDPQAANQLPVADVGLSHQVGAVDVFRRVIAVLVQGHAIDLYVVVLENSLVDKAEADFPPLRENTLVDRQDWLIGRAYVREIHIRSSKAVFLEEDVAAGIEDVRFEQGPVGTLELDAALQVLERAVATE